MIPLETVGSVLTPDGRELALYHRDGVFHIRIDGLELMSSRAHGSEEALAERACEDLGRDAPAVLVGGLGMGYTLRAALDRLPADARVDVVEVFAAVVEWNRGPLAALARRPLDDPRVRVVVRDLADVLASDVLAGGAGPFDAILLDVDNGPTALTLLANGRLYSREGLRRLRRILVPGGRLAVWSAHADAGFERRLRGAGFVVRSERVAARGAGTAGVKHTLFLARRGRESSRRRR